MAHLSVRQRPGGRAKAPPIQWSQNHLIAFGLAGALVVLLVLDTFTIHLAKSNELVKGTTYGIRAAIGIAVTLFGMRALLMERLAFRIRLLLGAYVLMLLLWLGNWALVQNVPAQIVTTNPSFSVFSWLLILAAPLMATPGVVEDLTKIVVRTPIWPVLPLLAAAVLFDMRGGEPYYPSIGNATILLCAFRRPGIEGTLAYRVAVLLVVTAIMLMAGVRAHALVALAMIAMLVVWPRITFTKTLVIVTFCLVVPLLYFLLITNVDLSGSGDMFADTRSFLFLEVTGDLDPTELMIGRGLGGTYFSPYFFFLTGTDKAMGGDFYQRNGVEVGWLNMILKFGIVGLSLFLAVVISFLMSFPRKAARFVRADPWRRVAIMLLLVFTMELPNTLNFHYLCWFIALGTLLPRAPLPAPRQKRSAARRPFIRRNLARPDLATPRRG